MAQYLKTMFDSKNDIQIKLDYCPWSQIYVFKLLIRDKINIITAKHFFPNNIRSIAVAIYDQLLSEEPFISCDTCNRYLHKKGQRFRNASYEIEKQYKYHCDDCTRGLLMVSIVLKSSLTNGCCESKNRLVYIIKIEISDESYITSVAMMKKLQERQRRINNIILFNMEN